MFRQKCVNWVLWVILILGVSESRAAIDYRMWQFHTPSPEYVVKVMEQTSDPKIGDTIPASASNLRNVAKELREETKPHLARGENLTEESGAKRLQEYAKTYSTLEQWQERAARIRQGILTGAELNPLPRRRPLNPRIHSRRDFDGYSVENIAIESLPGVFVTGNLYIPRDIKPPYAAMLNPHGHYNWGSIPKDDVGEGRFRKDMQYRCAALARMGVVCFAYDMVGWQEAKNFGWSHNHPKVLKLQLWNSIRALDYLLSRSDVDPARIGVTGSSGGGTQSFLLAAVDDRIALSAPAVMVSAHFNGGCICESGMPIHYGPHHEAGNVDIAALAAPRPQLLISCGGDWTKNTPTVELPYLQNVYRLFGKENNVENWHVAKEGHDYGYNKRIGLYPFVAKHFNLDLNRITDKEGKINEGFVHILTQPELTVFDDAHPLPANAVKGDDAVLQWN
jgi:hypothetical protein